MLGLDDKIRNHYKGSKIRMIRISIKCSCVEIFDQQESFKLDMIDLACGVIRILNNILALRYSINKVI